MRVNLYGTWTKRRRQWFFAGRYYDDVLLGLTREEFDGTQARP